MLADTDSENIKNFKTYIKMSFPDVRIVAALSSPADFREHVKAADPQLILADIRFFGALAFQIVREISEFFPDIRFIVYGSYNDAEYIQKIMEFGVIDYIYKPVKPGDLERTLKHAGDVFAAMESDRALNESLFLSYQTDIGIFKNKFLSNLIYGNLTSKFEIDSSLHYFGLTLAKDYTVLVARIDHFKKVILALDEKGKHLLVYNIFTIVQKSLSENNAGTVFINNLNELVLIVGGSMPLQKTIQLANQLKEEILHQTRQSVTIGIGRSYDSPADICVSYKEADAALRYRGYMGYNSVIPIHYVEPENNISYRYPMVKEEILVYSSVIGEYDYCETLLNQIMDALKSSGPLPEFLLSKIVMNIVIAINRYASEQNILKGNEFTIFFPTKDIFGIKSIDEASAYLSSSLEKFCDHVLRLRNDKKKEIVALAVDFIEKRYAGSLPISELALIAHTTPEFLSNTFQEIKKMSINDYISGHRIDKAKEIIRAGETDETAALVSGYKDIKTFREAFRKHEGMLPQDYRSQKK
jgi:two-component system response regulator YesN